MNNCIPRAIHSSHSDRYSPAGRPEQIQYWVITFWIAQEHGAYFIYLILVWLGGCCTGKNDSRFPAEELVESETRLAFTWTVWFQFSVIGWFTGKYQSLFWLDSWWMMRPDEFLPHLFLCHPLFLTYILTNHFTCVNWVQKCSNFRLQSQKTVISDIYMSHTYTSTSILKRTHFLLTFFLH